LAELDQLIEPAENQRIVQVASDMITIDGRRYQIELDHKQAFDREALEARYNEILDKYDYIVGDWGYDQLRLRGFYKPTNRHANKDQLINTLEDYLYEYCNFGCAYFVLGRLDAPVKATPTKRSRPKTNKPRSKAANPSKKSNQKPQPYTEKQTHPKKVQGTAKTTGQKPRKRHFTIRQRETETK